MALARIVTTTPEHVAALADYLRSRGYTVELIEPGTLRTTTAELEMDLQGCSAEEALAQGISAAEATHPRRQAIAYDITGRPVEFAEEEEEPRARDSNALAQAWNGLTAAVGEMGENLRLSIGRFVEWFQEGRQTIQEQVERRQEQRREAEAEAQRRQRERNAERLAEQAEQARLAQEQAARREAAERSRREREEAARIAEAERVRCMQQEAVHAAELAAAQERMRRQEECARSEEHAERERRIMEQYRREAHLDAVQERFQAEQRQVQKPIAPVEAVIARRETVRRSQPAPYRRDHDWKKAAVASIVLALLATLGYAAYENRQPASPLSNRDLVNSQKISQPVPFGTATAAPQQAAPPAQPHAALPQSDPVPVARQTEARPAHARRARRAYSGDDTIAEDEVIVHHHNTGGPTRAGAAGTSPKRISDLEQ